ncbi:MAG: nucleotidyltransferase domain-containing protein [Actinomycetota bacterium]|nr:nucleotidyltransferase domain-containing protein [Actinomycetota bacterium]
MRFHISLDKALNSRAKMKILKYLFGQEASMSEGELARIVRVSHMTINRLMKELQALNLVTMERIGNANVWTANKESYAYQVLSEIVKKIAEISPPLEHLKKTILKNTPKTLVREVILFGSIASGEEEISSDIDLFILVKSKQDKTKLEPFIDKLSNQCLMLYGNRLAPYTLTELELEKKKNLPLISEVRKGVQIYSSKGASVGKAKDETR